MPIKRSELNKKWYSRGARVFFWLIQLLVVIAMLSQGKGSIIDLVLGFVIYTLILVGIWKIFLYVAFGGVEKEAKAEQQ